MNKLDRHKFELHSETDEYEYRINKAKSNIEKIFNRHNNPYIAVSGGKDSTVMHHLVTQKCGYENIDVFHFDWGLRELPNIEEHIRSLVEDYGGKLLYKTSEKVNDEEEFAKDNHHGMSGIYGWVDRLSSKRNWSCVLLGIRAEESNKRRDQYTGEPPRDDAKQIKYAPIHHLSTTDIWSYIVDNNIQYHDMYDKKADLYGNIDDRSNRLVTIYDHQFSSLGSETISQFIYPEETANLKEIEQKYNKNSEEG